MAGIGALPMSDPCTSNGSNGRTTVAECESSAFVSHYRPNVLIGCAIGTTNTQRY